MVNGPTGFMETPNHFCLEEKINALIFFNTDNITIYGYCLLNKIELNFKKMFTQLTHTTYNFVAVIRIYEMRIEFACGS